MCITKILKYVFELKRDEVKSSKNIVVYSDGVSNLTVN